MERSPKLISESIDQATPLVMLSLEKTEPELQSTPWLQSRLYGLEFLTSSPHDGTRDRSECLDKYEVAVLIEAPSISLGCETELELLLDDEAGIEHAVTVFWGVVGHPEALLISSDAS